MGRSGGGIVWGEVPWWSTRQGWDATVDGWAGRVAGAIPVPVPGLMGL